MEDRTRVHVFVSGEVQGVNFRQAIADKANEQGVAGWVRNLPDGRVEAVFEGPKEAVESMVEWSHEGPRQAVVDSVEVALEAPIGEEGFRIR